MTATPTTTRRRRESDGRYFCPPARDPSRRADLDTLARVLDRYGAREIPCRRYGGYAWLSDDDADQESAATRCHGCPVLWPCRRYALAHPREAGVLGGLTEHQRRADDGGHGGA